MLWRSRLLATVLLMSSGVSVAAEVSVERPKGDPIPNVRPDLPVDHPLARFPNPDRVSDGSTIIRIKREAISGDPQAAFWLSFYYIDSANDALEGEFWLRLAAEFGDCEAREHYARWLTHIRNRKDWRPSIKLDACAKPDPATDIAPTQ